jgi:hypothetical protein
MPEEEHFVKPDDNGIVISDLLDEPIGGLLPAPVPLLSRGGRGRVDPLRDLIASGGVDLQPRNPGKRRSPPLVVDADVRGDHHLLGRSSVLIGFTTSLYTSGRRCWRFRLFFLACRTRSKLIVPVM